MITVEQAEPEELDLDGLAACPVELPHTTTVVDLAVNVADRGSDLSAAIEFRTDLFDPERIERLAGHLQTVLSAIADDPAQPIGELPILTAPERTQLLQFAQGQPLPPAAARPTCPLGPPPARAAIVAADGVLSHAELADRAHTLARHLTAQGIGPDDVVALHLPRGLDLVVAVLGVWQAGAAYLPLNPDDPAARIDQLVAAARPALTVHRLPDLDDRHHAAPAVPPAGPQHPDQLGVVLFTSGSSGAPKPVAVSHRNLAHTRDAWATVYHHEPHTWLSTTPHTTDVFAGDVLRSIGHGGTLVLADAPHLAIDPARLHETLRHHRVSAWEASPHTLTLLVDHSPEPLPDLRLLAVATSPYPARLHPRVRALAPHARVVTAYGLTETTVDSTAGDTDHRPRQQHFPIGSPLPGTTCFLLDEHGQPSPIGVKGTIYIGGDGVGRGYLGRPDLTADRFIANPFAPGDRLYRTGDLAHWDAAGRIHFHGRADAQLNHAGHRIEPAEIETVLAAHPDVAAAAVDQRTDHQGMPHLTAWLVPDVPGDIRTWLAQRLPAQLIPSRLHPLPELPLTANGKLDRAALPDLAIPNRATEPPSTATEHALAHIWRSVLGQHSINRHDNFFHLGGHSLLATQVAYRIESAFGIRVPLRDLFEHATLAGLGRHLDMSRPTGAEAPVTPAGRRDPLPMSFAQQRLWFLHLLSADSSEYHVPIALRLTGTLNHDALRQTLEEIVSRHEVLRTTLHHHADGALTQVVHPTAPMLLRTAVADDDTALASMVAEHVDQPFDLAAGPLVRTLLIRVTDTDHVLVVVMHHAVCDENSIGVLSSELATLYQSFAAGNPPPLAPLPVQYADYAIWQRDRLSGQRLDEQLDYWRRQLAGLQPLALPTDRPRRAPRTPAAATYTFVVDDTVADQLRVLSRHRQNPHPVHDPADRPAGLAGPLQRSGRHRGWHPGIGPAPTRDRTADRLLRQHARAAHRPVR